MSKRPSSEFSWHNLFRGSVRESLAATNCVARIGIQETRAWEGPLRYVVDDNQGNVGVVEFRSDGAVGAISAHTPVRQFDGVRAVAVAPARWQVALEQICRLPLLSEGAAVSALFWTAGEFIQALAPESWVNAGVELFRRELLADSVWEEDARAYYDLAPDVARLAIAIAARAVVQVPIVALSESELRLLIPKGAEHEEQARDLLTSDGLFEMSPAAVG